MNTRFEWTVFMLGFLFLSALIVLIVLYRNKRKRYVRLPEKVALISVWDKTGIVEFARDLVARGWGILASGGTAKKLQDAGIPVTDVALLVGGGAILGHRVVTLSREVHAGLLARLNNEQDLAELATLHIPPIQMVCVNFYPLENEVKKPGVTRQSIIDQTDIGGPCMVRSGAKGRRILVTDPAQYRDVITRLDSSAQYEEVWYDTMAADAEGRVAHYCLTSARAILDRLWDGLVGHFHTTLAYGETPESQADARWYINAGLNDDPLALHKFRQVTGSAPSFINVTDIDRLLATITRLTAGITVNFGKNPAIAIGCKHGNPCGVGVDNNPTIALQLMINGHPEALFGGSVITNFPIGLNEAVILNKHKVVAGRRILDVVVTPGISQDAVEELERKHGKCRIFVNPALAQQDEFSLDKVRIIRPVRGGFLTEPTYSFVLDFSDPRLVNPGINTAQAWDMVIAWAVASTSNSNTITLVKDRMLLGSGCSGVSRKLAAQVAVLVAKDAGHDVHGATAASDSFFPFSDGPQVLVDAGVVAVFTTTGSIRDREALQPFVDALVFVCTILDKIGRGFYRH